MTPERRCREHPGCEVVETKRNGRTVNACESGHCVTRWLVLDTSSGKVIGAGSATGGFLIAGRGIVMSAGPQGPCKNGHTDRWRRRTDWCGMPGKGWICGACHHESNRRLEARA